MQLNCHSTSLAFVEFNFSKWYPIIPINSNAWFQYELSLINLLIIDFVYFYSIGDVRSPKELTRFQRHVLSKTDNRGVYLVMADGVSRGSFRNIHIKSPNKMSCPRVGWTRGSGRVGSQFSRFWQAGSGRVRTSDLLDFLWLFLGTWIAMNLRILHLDWLMFIDIQYIIII